MQIGRSPKPGRTFPGDLDVHERHSFQLIRFLRTSLSFTYQLFGAGLSSELRITDRTIDKNTLTIGTRQVV